MVEKNIVVKVFKNKKNGQISFIPQKKKVDFLKFKKIPKKINLKVEEIFW